MMFSGEEAEKWGRKLAEVIDVFFKRNDQAEAKSNMADKREEIEATLASIWLEYEQHRTDPSQSLGTRVKDVRVARHHLNKALNELAEVPRHFLSHFYRMPNHASKFEDIVSSLEELRNAAGFFDRTLERGAEENKALKKAVSALADLYSTITGKKFAKTLKRDGDQFLTDGPEFVRQILHGMNSEADTAEIATAIKSYQAS